MRATWERIERLYWEVLLSGGQLPPREEGQTLVEYAIAGSVAVLIVMVAVKAFGAALAAVFTRLIQQVQGIA